MTRRPTGGKLRKAAAVVELSVCLPLLVFISLATIESCAMIYLKQSLKIAAYESSRVGVVDGANMENVTAQADLILATRNVSNYSVEMTPSDPTNLQSGDYFRVSISAPCVSNSLIGGWFFQSKTLTEFVEVLKE